MSAADRERWDARYRAGAFAERTHPSALLTEWTEDGDGRRALDVACGAGRNAIYLASRGYDVCGVDVSSVGIDRARGTAAAVGLEIDWRVHDLEVGLPDDIGSFDLIALFRYVDLELLAALTTRLLPGGMLIVEEHLRTEADVVGPGNPAFRVAPGALDAPLAGMDVLHTFEGTLVDPDGRTAALAQRVVRKS